ncbi:GNAT family N-acetyltransferase [Sciscionella marina]|uniref:GNAT family N-acetyltransferase n=1 Tax=Sciscionella marina TaxID=508770 RepID=UPI00037E166A|nr:GNAT family N-acetyltransferase [Sciscionella marina]
MLDLPAPLRARGPDPADHQVIVEHFPRWWSDSRSVSGAGELAGLVQPLFLEHFADTSLVVHDDSGELAAFLIALLSQSKPNESYIHFVGIDPEYRGKGIGKTMYEWFFATARKHDRDTVSAITGQDNHGSIAFHTNMGFSVDTSGEMVKFRRKI